MFKKILQFVLSLMCLSFSGALSQSEKQEFYPTSEEISQVVKYRKNKKANQSSEDFEITGDGLDYQLDSDENGEDLSLSMFADSKKDEYEDNDSIGKSKLISPYYDGTSAPSDYDESIDATLHMNRFLWFPKKVDQDYYQFRIYGKARVEINLRNIPGKCDYDLELLEHSNYRYATDEAVSYVASSINASDCQERIISLLLPGVYYIHVYSYNDTCDAEQKYVSSNDFPPSFSANLTL